MMYLVFLCFVVNELFCVRAAFVMHLPNRATSGTLLSTVCVGPDSRPAQCRGRVPGSWYRSQAHKPHLLQRGFQIEHLKGRLQVAPSCSVALEDSQLAGKWENRDFYPLCTQWQLSVSPAGAILCLDMLCEWLGWVGRNCGSYRIILLRCSIRLLSALSVSRQQPLCEMEGYCSPQTSRLVDEVITNGMKM